MGSELHVVHGGLVIRADTEDPYQDALFRLLGVFAQLEAELPSSVPMRVLPPVKPKPGITTMGYHSGSKQMMTISSNRRTTTGS